MMNEEKRRILEMVSEGKITEEQAAKLLEALDVVDDEPEAPEVEEEAVTPPAPAMPATPAMPAPPAMPAAPVMPAMPALPEDRSPESMEQYMNEVQERMDEYQQRLDEYSEQCEERMDDYARRYEEQMAKLRAQAGQQQKQPPQPPKPPQHSYAAPDAGGPTAGSWGSWISGIGEEIRQGLRDIGRELGRDLDSAMDDVSDAVSDLKDALGDVVEEWQEELEDEMEEQAEAMEEAAELAEENGFLTFNHGFGGDDDDDEAEGEQVTVDVGPEYDNGEFVYRSWIGLSAADKLEINWPSGHVSISPWDGDHVEIVERCKKALKSEQRSVIYVHEARQLSIREYPKNPSFNIGGNLFGLPSKRLELFIPRELCGQVRKLRVQCTSSGLDVSGLSGESFSMSAVSGSTRLQSLAAEVLDVNTVSGSLTVEGCSADKLQLHTVSGTNSCKGFSAGKADLGTVSGSLKAHGNAEKFKVSTVSGSASLMVDQCPEKATMHSVSGSLKIRLPENAGFTADFNSMSGSFNTDFPAQVSTEGKRKKSGRAVFGSGLTRIELHTTSGSMNVLKAEGLSV